MLLTEKIITEGRVLMWKPYRNKSTIGRCGSESGEIILDEDYDDSCRITLEKCEGHYAITCGIYGAMVHTAFCGEKDFAKTYEEMKNDLATFIKQDLEEDEEVAFYDEFTNKY